MERGFESHREHFPRERLRVDDSIGQVEAGGAVEPGDTGVGHGPARPGVPSDAAVADLIVDVGGGHEKVDGLVTGAAQVSLYWKEEGEVE